MKKINFISILAIMIMTLMATNLKAGNGPTSLTVYPTPQTLKVGETSWVYAKQEGAIGGTYFISGDETIASVTWGDLAAPHSYITVAQITAKKAGHVNIYAKCVNGLIATCEVTVIDDTDYSVDLVSSISLQVNETYTLVPVVYPPTAQTSFTWSSNNYTVAEVSQSGVVKAKSAGTATITVKASNGKTASCKVTVTEPVVYPTSVSVAPTSLSLEVNQMANLTATVYPSNATTTLTWSTSNSSVAKVSNGKVTAVGAGTSKITVKTSNGKTATCNVTVKNSGSSSSSEWAGTYTVTSSVDRKHVSDYNFPSSFTMKIKLVNGTYYVTEMLGLDLTHSIYEGIRVIVLDNQRAELDLNDNNDLGGFTTTGEYLNGLYLITTQSNYQWTNLGHLYLTRNSDGTIELDDFNVFAFGGRTNYDYVLDAVYHNVKASDTSSVPTILADSEQPYLLEIYDLQGNRLFSGQEESKPSLPSGIYIFRRGNNVQKIMVR